MCGGMPQNPYYNSNSTKPYTDFHIRPAMMLAGESAAAVKATIDKGVAADKSMPTGTGWFVRTADATRSSPRSGDFQSTVQAWSRPGALAMNYYDYTTNGGHSDVAHRSNILFYETGAANVPLSLQIPTFQEPSQTISPLPEEIYSEIRVFSITVK
jgi:uncharacterized protein (TIGR03790 family)